MKICDNEHCCYPDCDCQIDRISSHRRMLSRQYRIALRRLLIQEIQKSARKRGTTDKRIAYQLGFTPQAFSRLSHREGELCSVDSLLMYLARLGVGVQLIFRDFHELPEIEAENPNAHKSCA